MRLRAARPQSAWVGIATRCLGALEPPRPPWPKASGATFVPSTLEAGRVGPYCAHRRRRRAVACCRARRQPDRALGGAFRVLRAEALYSAGVKWPPPVRRRQTRVAGTAAINLATPVSADAPAQNMTSRWGQIKGLSSRGRYSVSATPAAMRAAPTTKVQPTGSPSTSQPSVVPTSG